MFGISNIFDSYWSDYQSFGFGRKIEEVVSNWQKDDLGKPIFPNWMLILTFTIQKGSLIPLGTFLLLTIMAYVLSVFRFGKKVSDLREMANEKGQKTEEIQKWTVLFSGATFLLAGLFQAYIKVFLENSQMLSRQFYDTYWFSFDYTFEIVHILMCPILIFIGFLTICFATKSRSTFLSIILLPSIITLFGLGIYSSVVSVSQLQIPNYKFESYRYEKFSRMTSSSLDSKWDTLMEDVFHCNRKDEENVSMDADIYLCEKKEVWRSYSYRDEVGQCGIFPFHQVDFCNGVLDGILDFLSNETFDLKKSYDSKYILSDCNITDKYEKYQSRYESNIDSSLNGPNATSFITNERKKKEEEWSEIKNNVENARLYSPYVYFADEINCSPYNQILKISIKTNIAISILIVVFSFFVFIALWKQAKFLASEIRKFVSNQFGVADNNTEKIRKERP